MESFCRKCGSTQCDGNCYITFEELEEMDRKYWKDMAEKLVREIEDELNK